MKTSRILTGLKKPPTYLFVLAALFGVAFISTSIGLLRLSEKHFSETVIEAVGASARYRGIDDLVQEVARLLCVEKHHLKCEIQALTADGEILTQIPTVPSPNSSLDDLLFTFKQDQFKPKLWIRVKVRPSFNAWIPWLGVGLLFGLLLVASGLLAVLRGRKARLALQLEKTSLELKTREAQASLGVLASQVSHDIKSPLSALDLVVSDLTGLPEEKRILVRGAVGRIKDIANNLLQKNREIMTGDHASPVSLSSRDLKTPQLLSSQIESILSEKRLQSNSKRGLSITSCIATDSLGAFGAVQAIEFKRLVSNLLNNAVEILGDTGKVEVALSTKSDQIELRVTDNGRGIPPEILKKLGQRGETHGKAEGSGLGLYHARTSVESWGGSLRIESELGVGTSVIILLPKANAPEWFVPELKLSAGGTTAIMDDDPSVKEIWRQRFEQLGMQEHGIEVRYFSNPDELETWVKSSEKSKEALFLLDFEIIGNKRTGLDVAEQLGIGPQAILVSSRWEELNVQARCSTLGMRLIPKGLAGFVPIAIKRPLEKLHAVLLDDDSLVTTSWASVAKQNQKSFRSFLEPVSFFSALEEIDRASPVFIDSNLGGGVKGQDLVPRVREMGFTLVYLATGYEAEQFAGLPGLTGIVGKEAPPEIGGVVIDWSQPV